MHRLNRTEDLERFAARTFTTKALTMSMASLRDDLLPVLTRSSRQFARQRVEAARRRVLKNYSQYDLASPEDLSPSEILTEVMYDRQFLRSSNENVSRATLARKVAGLVARREPIQMVIPALPYKCTSPLKCRGPGPDLAEVGFLLFLSEMAKALDAIYREAIGGADRSLAFFTVISDGRRFSEFLSEPDGRIARYQSGLRDWISLLSLEEHVGVEDYAAILATRLASPSRDSKARVRREVYRTYRERMSPLLDTADMDSSLAEAIRHEPDPETYYAEGRFVPLLKSLVYTINYDVLARYTPRHGESFEQLYATLTRHLFSPITSLEASDRAAVESFLADPRQPTDLPRETLYEFLRQEMLRQVWDATMRYLAEIRSDRDLADDPVATSFPDAIRWTIHAKRGQLALQSNPASGLPVQPWHGAGVFKVTRKRHIKLSALPCALLESLGALPVVLDTGGGEGGNGSFGIAPPPGQPLFYIHPDIGASTLEEFLPQLAAEFTRGRA